MLLMVLGVDILEEEKKPKAKKGHFDFYLSPSPPHLIPTTDLNGWKFLHFEAGHVD
jgi:hypothetical protein